MENSTRTTARNPGLCPMRVTIGDPATSINSNSIALTATINAIDSAVLTAGEVAAIDRAVLTASEVAIPTSENSDAASIPSTLIAAESEPSATPTSENSRCRCTLIVAESEPSAAPTSENSDADSSPSTLIVAESEPSHTPSSSIIAESEPSHTPSTSISQADIDFALARAIHEQERAFRLLQQRNTAYGGGYYGSVYSGYGYESNNYENYDYGYESNNYENYDYGGNQTSYNNEDAEAAHYSNYDNNYNNPDQVEHDDNHGEHDANTHAPTEFQAIENLAAEFSSHVGLYGDHEEQIPDRQDAAEYEAIDDTPEQGEWENEVTNDQQAWGESGWNEASNNQPALAESRWNNGEAHEWSTNYYGNQGGEQDGSEQPEWITGAQGDDMHAWEEGNTGWGAENQESHQHGWEEGGWSNGEQSTEHGALDEHGWNNANEGYDGWDEGGWHDENQITEGNHDDGERREEEEDHRWGTRDYEADDPEYPYEMLIALAELVGTVSKGLPAEAIASLPSVIYKEKNAQEDSITEKCVICQMDYEDDEILTVLHCKHRYHSECIKQWLQANKVCPVCNCEVSGS